MIKLAVLREFKRELSLSILELFVDISKYGGIAKRRF
jgi:hypothetical protein